MASVSRIRVLPPELASQIAAGEVAERPASVVKELIENALDADSTRCDVELEGGGITRLSVSDDGHGMSPEEALLALERHATSKLTAAADLMRLSTYGFRGEALPSIASVSRFALKTRGRGLDAGVEVVVEAGAAPFTRTVGMSPGTRIDVNDLFYNVPARRKFLRSSATEAGHITEVVENAALSRPDVTFTLTRDGRRVREFLRVPTRAERVAQVLSEDELAPCVGDRGPLAVEAFLSRPEQARTGAAGLHLFVNGRPVRDRALQVTIAHAYGSVLERGRYPRGAVFLTLPLELVDVNVHPQKAEVRFADPRAAGDALFGILSRALSSAFSLPERRPRTSLPGLHPPGFPGYPQRVAAANSTAAPPLQANTTALAHATVTAPAAARTAGEESDPEPATLRTELPLETQALYVSGLNAAPLAFRDSSPAPIQPSPGTTWASLRFIVQLRQTYLLCEGADGIYLLDQHAAAERVTFTRLRRQYKSRNVPAQSLLFPTLVDVTADEAELVEARNQELLEVGLDVRVRSADSLSIHAIPKLLVSASPERLLRDLLTEVSRKGERAFSDAIDLALATMACHGSVRAGDSLGANEATALLTALDEADFAGHCPHGRPVVTTISWSELERKVGRR